jgi:hypothetical protein
MLSRLPLICVLLRYVVRETEREPEEAQREEDRGIGGGGHG